MELVSLRAKAVKEGPLAFTELHLTFRNPGRRPLEGRFSITLPPDAAVSRFAMKVDAGWQESEVVERQRARRVYEDQLHRFEAPALLEAGAGNSFEARVHLVPARGRKELIISYSQELSGAPPAYRLPLHGLPRVGAIEVSVLAARPSVTGALGYRRVGWSRRNHTPDEDFVVTSGEPLEALANDRLVLARVTPRLDAAETPLRGLLVLVDSSASRTAGYSRQVQRVGQIIEGLRERQPGGFQLLVVGFDQSLSVAYEGPAASFGPAHVRALHARQALGASDLHGALRWAATQVGYDRVLLVTDGVATAGLTAPSELRTAASALGPRVHRIDALAVGGIRSEVTLRALVHGAVRRHGQILDGEMALAEVVRRLSQTTTSNLRVEVEGAEWVWPTQLVGMQPGDRALV
jgi:hypothetical protein